MLLNGICQNTWRENRIHFGALRSILLKLVYLYFCLISNCLITLLNERTIQWHKFLVPSKIVLLHYNVINGKLCSLCVIIYCIWILQNLLVLIKWKSCKILVTCCSFEVKSLLCGARLSISIIELPLTQSLVTTLHLAPLPSVQSEASSHVKKYLYFFKRLVSNWN